MEGITRHRPATPGGVVAYLTPTYQKTQLFGGTGEVRIASRGGYPESSTWTVAHRRWLARQQFQETTSELVFADLIA